MDRRDYRASQGQWGAQLCDYYKYIKNILSAPFSDEYGVLSTTALMDGVVQKTIPRNQINKSRHRERSAASLYQFYTLIFHNFIGLNSVQTKTEELENRN